MSEARYSPSLHRLALLTAAATLLLIFMGGLVTSHKAGMSVPDWPNSYGYNMFTFPPSKWIGGIFYEHTHRLMGTVVGILSIALTIVAWKVESRRWVRWLAASVLGAVIFQGVLGGLRVVLVKLDLAIVHACVAQAFFCLAALVAVVTSKWWLAAPDLSNSGKGRHLVRLAAVCAIAIYIQLILGATMRHYEAGLAIPDFPLSYGKLLPPTNSEELSSVAPLVTLTQVWLHFSHRVGAVLVSILLVTTAVAAMRSDPSLRRISLVLIVLLAAQVTLGILTVLWRKPADIASSHVAVGALTLMTTFVLTARAMRLYGVRSRRDSASTEFPDTTSLVPA